MGTNEYFNFLRSGEFAEIMLYTDEEIAEHKLSFIDKLFPLTYDLSERDSFVITISELRSSKHFQYAQQCMLSSLELFLNFFKIDETGTNVEFLSQLVPMKDLTKRIIRSLMYHELYTNANLLAFRFEKFRIIFRDYPTMETMFKSMWELEIISSIQEIEYFGYEYREPSLIKRY